MVAKENLRSSAVGDATCHPAGGHRAGGTCKRKVPRPQLSADWFQPLSSRPYIRDGKRCCDRSECVGVPVDGINRQFDDERHVDDDTCRRTCIRLFTDYAVAEGPDGSEKEGRA